MKTVKDVLHRIDNTKPNATMIKPGEEVLVKVTNAFGKPFKTLKEFEAFLDPSNEEEKHAVNHPCTGPIEVETEEKDVSLAIHILETKVTRAYQCVSKSTGLLKDHFTERACEVFEVKDGNRVVMRDGDLVLKTHPKIGFVSTMDDQERSCGRACENGGNIDLNYLDEGSIIYLPVNSDRARFMIGDLHACQGNGEAAGIAVEADGEIRLKVEIVDKIDFPVIDDKHRMIVVGWGETLEEAIRKATENSMEFISRIFPFSDWPKESIYKFLSAEGNLVLGNSTGKVKTCGMVFYQNRIYNAHDLPVF